MCEAIKGSYRLLEEIGRGRFGVVYRCFSPDKDGLFACKLVDRGRLEDPTDRECLDNEPKLMSLLPPHPHIVRIVDAFDSEDGSLCVVTELCEAETLYDRVVRGGLMSEAEAAVYMRQILQAIAHCHGSGVVHRDVKPENLMFGSCGDLKLGDFGSAVWSSGGRSIEGVVGTPYYIAPEVLTGRLYDEKVDVWSAGAIMYVMLSGVPPFYGESAEEIFEAVARANLRFPPNLFRSVSPEAKDLMRKMMCRDVSRRLLAEQALRHPWISSGGVTRSLNDVT